MWDPRFPQTWSLNSLRVTEALGDAVGADELAGELDRLYARHPHRMAMVEDEATGAHLAPGLAERGWRTTREVVMALRAPRDREPEPGLAREAGEADAAPVEILSMLEEDELNGAPDAEAVARQVVAARAAQRRAQPRTRRFVGRWGGRDGSVATLFADGTTAQVEAVGTITPLRGHGLARAVVSAAVDAALADGHEHVFIVADDEDWPKELYAKLGFRPVGRIWQLVRMPRRG